MKDNKEVRVPGRAIPTSKRREGALGKLDAMRLSRFQRLPLPEQQLLISDARMQKLQNVSQPAELTKVPKEIMEISLQTLHKNLIGLMEASKRAGDTKVRERIDKVWLYGEILANYDQVPLSKVKYRIEKMVKDIAKIE